MEPARQGDAEALRQFLELARTRLLRWAIVKTGSMDEAEDLAQEGLMKVSQKLDQFDGRGRCSTWLYGVHRNTHLDRARTRQARRRAEMRVILWRWPR